jgi:hypothetical protein
VLGNVTFFSDDEMSREWNISGCDDRKKVTDEINLHFSSLLSARIYFAGRVLDG